MILRICNLPIAYVAVEQIYLSCPLLSKSLWKSREERGARDNFELSFLRKLKILP